MATNEYGLDVSHFNSLLARELHPTVVASQTPAELARALARAARTACAAVLREEEFEWFQVRAAGEMRKGDKLRIYYGTSGSAHYYHVKDVLNPGGDGEEIIVNTRRNLYFSTRMLLEGNSWAKRVLVRNRPAQADGPAQADA